MPSDMQHERMRWAYMTPQQLLTRLRRITRHDKLRNFITLAEENRRQYGYEELLETAYDRARTLKLEYLVPVTGRRGLMPNLQNVPVQAERAGRWTSAIREMANRGELNMDEAITAKVAKIAKVLKKKKVEPQPKVRMIRIGKGAK